MRRMPLPTIRTRDGWIIEGAPAYDELYRVGETATLGGRHLYATTDLLECLGYESWCYGPAILAAYDMPADAETVSRAPELDGQDPTEWVAFAESVHSGSDAVTYRAPRAATVQGRVLARRGDRSATPCRAARREWLTDALTRGWSMADRLSVVAGPCLSRRAALALRSA